MDARKRPPLLQRFFVKWERCAQWVYYVEMLERTCRTVKDRPLRHHWVYSVVFSGHMEFRTPTQTWTCDAGEAILLPPATFWQFILTPVAGKALIFAADVDFEPGTREGNPIELLALPAKARMGHLGLLRKYGARAAKAFLAGRYLDPVTNDLVAIYTRWMLHHFFLQGIQSGDIKPKEAVLPPLMQVLLEHIQQHCARNDYSISELARFSGYSRTYLFQLFRQYLHQTPLKILQAERIKNACYLLKRDPARSLRDVAQRCGYATLAPFHMQFRRLTGLSPRRWAHARQRGVRRARKADFSPQDER